MHHSNIDRAIAYVIERRQQLNVPNVFAAYLQAVIYPNPYDDDSIVQTDDAIARAALVTFERAMDKYPMPTPPARTKKSKSQPSAVVPAPNGRKRYSAEVAQLRWEYQQATLRASAAEGEYHGCSCLSCGGLMAMRDRLPALSSEGEDGELLLDLPVRARRTRKAKKQARKKVQLRRDAIPVDPYAPSSSAAVL
ncbi:hypothetical protein DICSQDRAFT_184232 [Dichomitus squalens LYAD-421 SS1]|uniref:Uncharacterized protein n=1 Tax=Dichomitus squalens (strain LYAD-421) TaxID=732165 RepID=R7SJ46_DICSQ|nr:uncharacterized protein DICSQDRAFT_184232 [Dichomitus squalens LYAD-421 SS1]EJF55725.1 hypothetical protein DICSQDRAFT_184232 [Dichomitus squalens LYAD-421 SS1]